VEYADRSGLMLPLVAEAVAQLPAARQLARVHDALLRWEELHRQLLVEMMGRLFRQRR